MAHADIRCIGAYQTGHTPFQKEGGAYQTGDTLVVVPPFMKKHQISSMNDWIYRNTPFSSRTSPIGIS
jgi:hypothetical protein